MVGLEIDDQPVMESFCSGLFPFQNELRSSACSSHELAIFFEVIESRDGVVANMAYLTVKAAFNKGGVCVVLSFRGRRCNFVQYCATSFMTTGRFCLAS